MTTARTTKPLRAAVVGSGGISKEHMSFLSGRTLAGPVDDRIHLVAVCDLSQVAADYAAREFGAYQAFTDISAMLAEAKPDVVHILTPPSSHVALASMCLEAGSHVICEKPITPTAPELEQLLGLARQHERHVMESHNYRFNRGILAMRQAVDEGRLGTIREVEIRIALPVTDPEGRFGDLNLPSPIHQLPAGVIHDFTTHFSYLLLHFAGPVVFDRVAAAWSNHSDNPVFKFDDLDALLVGHRDQPGHEADPVHARLRFDAGASPDAFTVRVRGDRGWAETDLFQPYDRTVIPRPGGSQLSPIVNHVVNGATLMKDGVRNFGQKLLQNGPYEGLHRMLDETYAALAAGRPLPVSPDDMLSASRLVDRLLDEGVQL